MRASFVWITLLTTLAGCTESAPQQAERTQFPRANQARAGTVETIAGPGYCLGTSVRDRSSEEVGALSMDREGRIYFETGPRGNGFVARVERDGRLAKIPHLTERGPYDQDPLKRAAPAAGRLAADGAGGVYLAAGSKVVQLDRQGALRNIAGDPKHPPPARGAGSSGDGGPAEAARFSSARSLVSDENGNLYIADQSSGSRPAVSIRFINRTPQTVTLYPGTPFAMTVQPGHIATIAGGPRSTGSGVPQVSLPGGFPALAVTRQGLYVSTFSGATGRRSASTVTLINISGGPLSAHGRTIEPGAAGQLFPEAPSSGGASVKASPDGTSAGSRSGRRSEPGKEPALRGPISGQAADPAGNLYLADTGSHRVFKMNSSGVLETFAGADGPEPAGFNGNDRRARGAQLNRPFSVAAGPGGRIYVSDQRNHQVRFIDEAGIIRAAPGAGVGLTWRCRGSGQQRKGATDNTPRGGAAPKAVPVQGAPANVAADEKGNVYFTNSSGHQVKRADDGGVVHNVVGDGRPAQCSRPPRARGSNRNVALAQGRLRNPSPITLGSGGIYVADCDNARISFINRSPQRVRVHGQTVEPRSMITIAGSGVRGFSGDGQKATAAALGGSAGPNLPSPASPIIEEPNAIQPGISFGALSTDGKGNLYVADTGNGRVRLINRSGVISTIAGEGKTGALGDCCRRPSGLAVDRAGNLYVLDVATLQVWFLNRGRVPLTVKGVRVPAGSAAPVAGNGGVGFEGEGGPATRAQLLFPMGIALDAGGNLYIVEVSAALGRTLFDPVIRGVDVRSVDAGGTIRTVLGPGHVGFNGDGLKPSLTSLTFPTGIAADRCGNLLIADLGSDRIRRVNAQPPCQ